MFQKSGSKTIAKFRYFILVPLMLAMLTYVSYSQETRKNPEENALSEYTYTVNNSGEMSAATKAKHDRYEDFLINDPDYVGWATIDRENDEVTYTIHPKEEQVPEDYHKLKFSSPEGESYTFFMNLKNPDSKTENRPEAQMEMISKAQDSTDVPFAIVEEIPVFPGCEKRESIQASKSCMSEKIHRHVSSNFNIKVAKKLGLEGLNRIHVQFRIAKDGNIEILEVRAPHPALQEEAERVVKKLPQMSPGKHKGEVVGVLYSLPISFRLGE